MAGDSGRQIADAVRRSCADEFQELISEGVDALKWESFDADAIAEFARKWLLELRGDPSVADEDTGAAVVIMNFTAPTEFQWSFILAAVALAENADELGHIAAGPLEHLLGFHGEQYIGRIEDLADGNAKFAQTIAGVWRHKATDAVWERVQAIQSRIRETPPTKKKSDVSNP